MRINKENKLNKQFLESLQNTSEYPAIFNKLYTSVIETNKLIGLDIDEMSEEDREALTDTYYLLRVEEGKEVEEAIKKEDRTNLVNELIDILVVAGYEYYLSKGVSYSDVNTKCGLPYYEDYDLEVLLYMVTSKYSRGLSETIEYTQDALIAISCNLEKAIDEVLKANLSKFPTCDELITTLNKTTAEYLTETTAIEYQTHLLEKGGRYSGVTCEKVIDSKGEERLVFWSEKEYDVPKRKYLKPVSYVEANLNGIWE
jgi:hypothetical protein